MDWNLRIWAHPGNSARSVSQCRSGQATTFKMKNINTLGEEFVKKHQWLLELTKTCGVAVCGGCGAAIAKNDTAYQPPDLDLVSTQEGAIQLLSSINRFLIGRSTHFRVYANTNNEYVPAPAIGHFRITSSFWVPICIFILPPEMFRYYRISEGYMIQLSRDIKQAADDLTEKDGKSRTANQEWDWWEEKDEPIKESTRRAIANLPEDYVKLHREAYLDAAAKCLSGSNDIVL
jgi:hypothetical protein